MSEQVTFRHLELARKGAYAMLDIVKRKFPKFIIQKGIENVYVRAEFHMSIYGMTDGPAWTQCNLLKTVRDYEEFEHRLRGCIVGCFRGSACFLSKRLDAVLLATHRSRKSAHCDLIEDQLAEICAMARQSWIDVHEAAELYYDTYVAINALRSSRRRQQHVARRKFYAQPVQPSPIRRVVVR